MKYRKSGFTLVEIILALALFAILAIAFVPAFVSAFRWITDAGKQSNAIYNSQNSLEDIVSEWIGSGVVGSTSNINLEFNDGGTTTSVPLVVEDFVNGDMEMFLRDSVS